MNVFAEKLKEWKPAEPPPSTQPLNPQGCTPVKIKCYEPRGRELVAGGDIKWKPIDRQAALLLAKGIIDETTTKPTDENTDKARAKEEKAPDSARLYRLQLKGRSTLPKRGRTRRADNPKDNQNGSMNINSPINVDPSEAIRHESGFSMKIAKQTSEGSEIVLKAAQSICESAQSLVVANETMAAACKVMLSDVRSVRMALVGELAQMTGPLKEVRQFFLGPDYDREITRLREFVELCERLDALKKSGFLDAVSDTMLKLAQ